MLKLLNIEEINIRSQQLREEFSNNSPFQHTLLNSLLSAETWQQLNNAFPEDLSWPHWTNRLESEHIAKVHACEAIEKIPNPIDRLIYELYSAPFLKLLSKITGIPGLLPDPHLLGGGLHMVAPGGYLTPHTDFHVKEQAPRFRQLNLILYLNENWSEENGGAFELWDKKTNGITKKVAPELGTCLLFKTDYHSQHGYSQPVNNRYRRSIALFYYTVTENSENFLGDAETYWRVQTLKAKNPAHWLRLKLQQFHFGTAKIASKISFSAQMRARSLIAWENKAFKKIHLERIKTKRNKATNCAISKPRRIGTKNQRPVLWLLGHFWNTGQQTVGGIPDRYGAR